MSEVRMPTQKRSIATRNKIIEKGFELMCQKGYYNTNTNEIADYSGVSTGIIYQYFNDKRDIFIEGIKSYSASIMFPTLDILTEEVITTGHYHELLDKVINKFIETHTLSKKAHEEMMAMSHIDEGIAKIFQGQEIEITNKIVAILKDNNFEIENSVEKIHIIIGLIENLCHEIVYHQHKAINYEIMKNETISIIENILK